MVSFLRNEITSKNMQVDAIFQARFYLEVILVNILDIYYFIVMVLYAAVHGFCEVFE